MAMEHETGSGTGPDSNLSRPDQQVAGEAVPTGEPRVDAALRRLAEVDDLPASEHPGVYERIHEQLVEVLGDLHTGQGGTHHEHR